MERNGNFWIENLPVGSGSTVWTLIVTDALGNVAQITSTVSAGDSGLTIDTPSNLDQLWNPTITVYGTINANQVATYKVWVNGINASYTGGGAWEADNVPLPEGGTAVIQARAIPITENGGNGTGGSGGGPVSYDNMGNPDPPGDEDTEIAPDRPTRWYRTSYHEDWNDDKPHNDVDFEGTYQSQSYRAQQNESYNGNWQDTGPQTPAGKGKGIFNHSSSGTASGCAENYSVTDCSGYEITEPGDLVVYNNCSGPTGTGDGYLTVLDEHCQVSPSRSHDDLPPEGPPPSCTLPCPPASQFWHYEENFKRNAQATWVLQTGGKGVPGRMNLWRISGTATHILDPWAPLYDILWPGEDIPSQQLTVMGRSLGTAGYFYRLLPDGSKPMDITVYASGYDFYTYAPYCGKFHFYIRAIAGGKSYNLDTNTPEFCVGQKVTFELDWDPYTPGYVDYSSHWTVPQKFVNEKVVYWSGSPECDNYDINWTLLQNRLSTSCWFVNKPGGEVGVWVNLHFFNGQYISIAADGKINILRPRITRVVPNGPFGAAIDTTGLPFLRLFNGPMDFYVYISETYPGSFGMTQLVSFFSQTGAFPTYVFHSTYGNYYLDGPEFYDSQTVLNLDSWPSDAEYPMYSEVYDTPGQYLWVVMGSYNGHWKDYVRFTPSGTDSIPITLGRIEWNWAATADQNSLIWSVTSDGVGGPTLYREDDSFPLWDHEKPSADPQSN